MSTEDQGYAEVVSENVKPTKKSTRKVKAQAPAVVEEHKQLVRVSNTGVVDLSSVDSEKIESLRVKAEAITNDNILTLGSKAQSGMSGAADRFLEKVRATDVNVLGNTLMDLKKEINQIDLGALQPMGPVKRFIYSLPGMKKMRGSIANMFDKYDYIGENVNKIVNTFVTGQVEIVKDNEGLSIMRAQTEQNIIDITDDLITAQLKIEELKQDISMMNQNPQSYDANEISDAQLFLDNLERHSSDLNVTRITMAQSLIDIRIIRQGNDVMLQKTNSAINNTLPIWKQTMALGVSLARQRAGIDKLNAFTEYTNQMLIQKAEMVNSNSTAIAKANERSIVDYETVKKVHDLTLSTLKELETIQTEGRVKRETSNANIKKLISDMDSALLTSSAQETKVLAARDTNKK